MADVSTSTSVNQYTFTLENLGDSSDIEERAISIEAPTESAAARSLGSAFVTGYMASFANATDPDSGAQMGSLIQPNGWRDDNVNQNAYKCTGVAVTHIVTTKNYYDL